jgi:hypothetical protein
MEDFRSQFLEPAPRRHRPLMIAEAPCLFRLPQMFTDRGPPGRQQQIRQESGEEVRQNSYKLAPEPAAADHVPRRHNPQAAGADNLGTYPADGRNRTGQKA